MPAKLGQHKELSKYMNRRSVVFSGVAVLAMLSCAKSPPPPPREPEHRYSLAGVVVRLDAKDRVATIEHGDIRDDKGKLWMEAMTMEFPVPEWREFSKLHKGQRIRATVNDRPSDFEYWLSDIQIDSPNSH